MDMFDREYNFSQTYQAIINSARTKTVIFPPANSGTSGSNYNPRNTQCIPVVIIFAFLDLGKNSWFSFRH